MLIQVMIASMSFWYGRTKAQLCNMYSKLLRFHRLSLSLYIYAITNMVSNMALTYRMVYLIYVRLLRLLRSAIVFALVFADLDTGLSLCSKKKRRMTNKILRSPKD